MRFIKFLLDNYELVKKADVKGLSSVCLHSGKVKDSSLFIAVKGRRSDGHNYLAEAAARGAKALLAAKPELIPPEFKGLALKYKKGGLQLSRLLNEFYNFPSEKLFIAGVTGSNGKTSFCYMLRHIFNRCGLPAALMGTVERRFKDFSRPAPLTTPDPAEAFERINDFVNLGAKALVMEVSSIALDQNRTEGLDFNALVFTNLSQDHLDYHKSMESYFQSKAKFFTSFSSGRPGGGARRAFSLINQDDEYGQRLKAMALKPCYTYGQSPLSDFCFRIKERGEFHSLFELKGPSGACEFFLPLPGDYNVYNAAAAALCAVLTGFKIEDCAAALKNFKGAPGRLERVFSGGKLKLEVFIDYAHSPSALQSVLGALKPYRAAGRKIILAAGCGGDRDKEKRPQMAAAALKAADHIFWTADNPRFEEPEKIIKDSLRFVSPEERKKITVELDRKAAIKKALQFAGPGDVILIAGKGHEQVQIVKEKRIPFCDKTAALQSLKELDLI